MINYDDGISFVALFSRGIIPYRLRIIYKESAMAACGNHSAENNLGASGDRAVEARSGHNAEVVGSNPTPPSLIR